MAQFHVFSLAIAGGFVNIRYSWSAYEAVSGIADMVKKPDSYQLG